MPFVIPAFGVSATDSQGMTRTAIIDMANRRTKGIGAELDMNGEFMDALQSLCMEHWWWWKKKVVYWDTETGVSAYDLAEPESPIYELDVHKVVGVFLYDASGCKTELTPIFDEAAQIEMLQNPGSGKPGVYFIIPGTLNQVQLFPAPDQPYRVWFNFWAMPNMTVDRLDDKVPLVPGFLHRLLVLGMECNILRTTDYKKFIATQALYDKKVEDADQAKNFADGDTTSWASEDTAIRSTC